MRDSLREAFEYSEAHQRCYLPFRDMVLHHTTLDVAGLAPAFKEKDAAGGIGAEDSTAVAEGECARALAGSVALPCGDRSLRSG